MLVKWRFLAVNFIKSPDILLHHSILFSLHAVSGRVNNFLLGMTIFLLFKNVQFSRAACVFFKFCFQWEKTFSETHEMLKQAFGNDSMGWTWKGLKTAKLWLKMTHILDDFPRQKVNNTLKKSMKSTV